jgi:uncharacterized membrane protein
MYRKIYTGQYINRHGWNGNLGGLVYRQLIREKSDLMAKLKIPLLAPEPKSTRSSIAIAGHPVHPMLVSFPIAYLLAGLLTDIAFWWTGDPFWARVSVWVIGGGLAMGTLAALAGTLDFLLVKEIRRHITSWSHFLAAVMLLALAATNWWLRFPDPVAGLLPWGLFLSCITLISLLVAGWLGGKLVFEHNIGLGDVD